MNLPQAVILGIVQGITEFLPISSSGHLILVPYLFNWPEHSLSFDVALHLGTALSVLVFFWRDWLEMCLSLLKDLGRKGWTQPSRILLRILIVSVPVGLIGVAFGDFIEETLRAPVIAAVMLIVVSIYMYLADNFARHVKTETPNLKDSFLISLSQVVALIPGSSRSGMTISTSLFLGYTREQAARFSFLLATPIILGAAVVKVPHLLNGGQEDPTYVLIGLVTSFIFGLLAVKFLLDFLKKYSLKVFIIYRILLALLILAFLI